MTKELVYLACPYSHLYDDCCRRFDIVNRLAATLMRAGVLIFSPISHGHPIAEYGLPKGWDFWERYDRVYIEAAKAMLVCAIDGWETSVGVGAEMRIAQELGIPIGLIYRPFDEEHVVLVAKRAGLIGVSAP